MIIPVPQVTAVLDGGPTGSAELQSRARAAALCVDWLLTVLQVHGGNDALATPVCCPYFWGHPKLGLHVQSRHFLRARHSLHNCPL
jgi:hypothetical protein